MKGMLWLTENTKLGLTEHIRQAAAYYQKKYGDQPNMCLVNPHEIKPGLQSPGIEIKSSRSILPKHLLIGVEQARTAETL